MKGNVICSTHHVGDERLVYAHIVAIGSLKPYQGGTCFEVRLTDGTTSVVHSTSVVDETIEQCHERLIRNLDDFYHAMKT